MKKSAKIVTIILACTAILIFAAGWLIELAEKNKFKASGLVFAQNNCYYAFSATNLNPVVSLVAFDIKKNRTRLLDYEELELVDIHGKVYSPLTMQISFIFDDVIFSRAQFDIVLDMLQLKDNTETVFRRARLKIGDKYDEFDIGRVVIEVSENETMPPSLSFGAFTQTSNTLTNYSLQISNNTDSAVTLKNLKIDLNQVKYTLQTYTMQGDVADFVNDFVLESKESIILYASFSATPNIIDYPFAAVKPLLVFEMSGTTYTLAMNYITAYSAFMDRDEIIEYINRSVAK